MYNTVQVLQDNLDIGDVQSRTDYLKNIISQTVNECIPRKGRPFTSLKPPWWNQDLTESKRNLERARRLMRIDRSEAKVASWKSCRNTHTGLIRRAKMLSLRNFAKEANINVWSAAFRWAKKGSRTRDPLSVIRLRDGTLTDNIENTARELLRVFVPEDRHTFEGTKFEEAEPHEGYGQINLDEVKAAIWRKGPNKSPGSDGITAGILRKARPAIGQRLTDAYRDALKSHVFPTIWKQAELILNRKKNKSDSTNTKSYRPVSLLPVMGKVLETLVSNRLKDETSRSMSNRQHGFTPEVNHDSDKTPI